MRSLRHRAPLTVGRAELATFDVFEILDKAPHCIVVTDIQSVRQLFQLQALELKIAASTLVINAETKLLNELVKELLSAAIEAERRVPERSGYPGAIDETEDVA